MSMAFMGLNFYERNKNVFETKHSSFRKSSDKLSEETPARERIIDSDEEMPRSARKEDPPGKNLLLFNPREVTQTNCINSYNRFHLRLKIATGVSAHNISFVDSV